MKTLTNYFVIVFTLLIAYTSHAQEEEQATSSKWEFIVEPFGLAGNLNGDIIIGLHGPVQFEMTFHDILEHLKIAGFVHLEAQKGNWGIMFDYVGMTVGAEIEKEKFKQILVLDAHLKKSVTDLVGMYRIPKHWGWIDFTVGTRMWHMNLELQLENENGEKYGDKDSSENQRWLDPIFGSRFMFKKPNAKFFFALRTDIGGFGMGSNFTYNIEPGMGYKFSKLLTGTLKYRYLNGEYDNDKNGEDHFYVDVTLKGPALGLQFTF